MLNTEHTRQRKTTSQSKYSPIEVVKEILQFETQNGAEKHQRTKRKVFYSALVNFQKSKIISAKGGEQGLTVLYFSHYY